MRKTKAGPRKRLLLLLPCILILGVIGAILINNSLDFEALMDAPLEQLDVSTLKNGTHAGSYQSFPISAKVTVRIEDGQMTEVLLVDHSHGRGYGAEAIVEKVREAQSLQVDLISGATYSSKVILLAIYDALKKSKTDF